MTASVPISAELNFPLFQLPKVLVLVVDLFGCGKRVGINYRQFRFHYNILPLVEVETTISCERGPSPIALNDLIMILKKGKENISMVIRSDNWLSD